MQYQINESVTFQSSVTSPGIGDWLHPVTRW